MAKRILITGSTGMVGNEVLKHLLSNPEVNEIISVTRRSTGISSEKLTEVIHQDFLNYSGLDEHFVNIDICYYCLAVYQNQVSAEEYEIITCDYQKILSFKLYEHSPEAKFVLFGAGGADPSGKSKMSFARVKGKSEKLLEETNFPVKLVYRAGYIHPVGSRRPTGTGHFISFPIFSVLMKIFPKIGLRADNLAEVMVYGGLCLNDNYKVFNPGDIQQYWQNLKNT